MFSEAGPPVSRILSKSQQTASGFRFLQFSCLPLCLLASLPRSWEGAEGVPAAGGHT